jgi:hypothetical protein
MDLLIYLAVLIASFLGLFIGIFISNTAIEEIKQSSKYLKYLNIILAPIIIFIATFQIHKTYSAIFTAIVLLALIITRNKYNDAWIYAGMGALIYISTISQEIINVAIIIFIYGISIATINASKHFKHQINGQVKISENITLIKKILIKYSYYPIIGIIFFIVFSYVL